jgi:hypothetical protein
MATQAEAEILTRVLSRLVPDAAPIVLKLEFTSDERDRMHVLAEKARARTLTEAENEEMEGYITVGHLLSTMHSKARQSLKKAIAKKTPV